MAQGDVFGVIKCDLSQVLPWFFGCGIAREKTFYVILIKLTNSNLNDRNIAKDIISEGSLSGHRTCSSALHPSFLGAGF